MTFRSGSRGSPLPFGRGGGGGGEEASALHEARLDAIVEHLVEAGARTVVDLGCGTGPLLSRLLAVEEFTRIVGLDTSFEALAIAEELCRAPSAGGGRLEVRYGSFMEVDPELAGVDAAAMVETLEHVPPAQLSRVERAVFARMRPALVLITTPNRDYNEICGVPRGEMRHADHRFEWGRARFESWARGVASRNDYTVRFEAIGFGNAWLGGPTQMAIFQRSSP